MKTVLVTGAQGLLGSHLVPLLAEKYRVFAVGRAPTQIEKGNVTVVAADLAQAMDTRLLPDKIDSFVYLAQSSRFRDFPGGAADMRQINLDQPLSLIEEARQRGASAFVYASSGSVYAPSGDPLTEDAPTAASSFYAATKLAAEQLLHPYDELMNVTALRFFFIYGPGQRPDMLVPRLIDNVRRGGAVFLQGAEGLSFNPIYADDAARAVAAALELNRGATINVAGPEEVSLRKFCDLAAHALGTTAKYEVSGTQAPRVFADIGRMELLLGPPSTRVADGIARCLQVQEAVR